MSKRETRAARQPRERSEFQLHVPCRLSEVKGATNALMMFLADENLPRQWRDELELAFVEACNNAIEHCTTVTRNLPLEIEARRLPDKIEVRITDHTAGFDWPARPALPPEAAERGRGIYLIRALTNEVEYARNRSGNVLRFSKSFPPG